jgi:hypothetical protein
MLDAFGRLCHRSIEYVKGNLVVSEVALGSTTLMYQFCGHECPPIVDGEMLVSPCGKLRRAFKVNGAVDLPPALAEAPHGESYQSGSIALCAVPSIKNRH